ncbi:MAG TPA: addiction module protein [Acetobacteraceae bacterium]|nr:addiction module protein [Acetobacteraceae bacterium]
MQPALKETLKKLPPTDRLDLIGELWDSLQDEDVPVRHSDLDLVRQRADTAEAHRAGRRDWSEVRAEIEKLLR